LCCFTKEVSNFGDQPPSRKKFDTIPDFCVILAQGASSLSLIERKYRTPYLSWDLCVGVFDERVGSTVRAATPLRNPTDALLLNVLLGFSEERIKTKTRTEKQK
jgi:hypothetical protein